MKHGTRVAFVVGGSGIVAIALLMTATGSPAGLAVTRPRGALERPSAPHTSRLGKTHAHATAQVHTPGATPGERSSSRSSSATTPTTTSTPTTTNTTTTTTTVINITTSTTAPPKPSTSQSTTSATTPPSAAPTIRFVSGRLAPPFTSTTVQQATLPGVASAVLTWSGNVPLLATLACGDRRQQRSGTDGLYLAVHATAGTCSVEISEVPPTSSDVVSYELELTYETATR